MVKVEPSSSPRYRHPAAKDQALVEKVLDGKIQTLKWIDLEFLANRRNIVFPRKITKDDMIKRLETFPMMPVGGLHGWGACGPSAQELKKYASKMKIPGRSKMDVNELREAVIGGDGCPKKIVATKKIAVEKRSSVKKAPVKEKGKGSLETMKVVELRALAKEKGISGYSGLKKSDLIALISKGGAKAKRTAKEKGTAKGKAKGNANAKGVAKAKANGKAKGKGKGKASARTKKTARPTSIHERWMMDSSL
jgi:hypothetical protein